MNQIVGQAAQDVELDEGFYAAAYPQAVEDVARGRADSLAEHYLKLGRYRGYLPHLRAERPRDPANVRSVFGGLWTDQGNALDLVEGRLALGRINPDEAALLRNFIVDGYVVLKQAVPWRTLRKARKALEDAYAGKLPGLRFCCPHLGFEVGDWQPGVVDVPAKALDIHAAAAAVRDAQFAPAISNFLGLIFDRRAMASQSLGFWRGSTQHLHQDSAYVTYSLPLQFAASWIALEDVRQGAGELVYRAGSHTLGDFLYGGRFKAVSEGRRLNGPDWDPKPEELAHGDSLIQRSDQAGHEERTFLAKAGDVLIWAADLAHGGKPLTLEHTRKSIVTHYCPAEVAPLYFEGGPRQIWRHKSGNYYSTLV